MRALTKFEHVGPARKGEGCVRAAFRFEGMLLALLVAWAMALPGCGKSGSGTTEAGKPKGGVDTSSVAAPAVAADLVDVTQLEKAFASADRRTRFAIDETIQMIRARAYGEALPGLQRLAQNANLAPEQRQAVVELITKLKTPGSGVPAR